MIFSIKSLSSLLLPIFLVLSSTTYSFSHGASQNLYLQTLHIPGTSNESEYGVVSWGMKRSVLEGNNGEAAQKSSLILAAERTHRKDPLDNLKYYTGGWNISDKHYFFSVAFTGVPLFLTAAIWFVGFGLSSLLLCLCCCCCQRRQYGYSRTAYALSLIFLSLFTIAAVVGCVVLYTGQGKFHNSTSDTLDYVVRQSNLTVQNLRNVSDYLAAAKHVGVYQVFLPRNVQNSIEKVEARINASATTLEHVTMKNRNNIDNVLNSVRIALIVIAAVMLVVALLGFLFSVIGLQFLVYFLVMIGWILIACTFVLCGVFLVLHNIVGDTCTAMDEWAQNPTAHTALDDILPCVDSTTAQQTLSQSKEVNFQLVGIVNGIITNVSNINAPSPGAAHPLYYNQSGPLVPVLCNPFNSDKSARICAAGEVDFNNATQVWKNYVCQVSASNICNTTGRLTPQMYEQMESVVNVNYGLYHYSPFLIGLLDCSFVRDTFSSISVHQCPDLSRYSKWIYIGFAIVSAAVMLSLIFWVVYARERQHRKYTKLSKAASDGDSFGQKRP
ncbi:uncharacterized protein LOC114321118 [Camellia sinensis]|uniref:uncharacterized protein LOC114321118 n=1 Tax=Camellia sinensis TaxID=4442 RepID=UPI00103573A1|nr:uncharacterized protein LOC114321118 [Camellia sinensis]